MKRMKWFWIAVLVLIASPALAETTGNINIFLGSKTLDSNDWSTSFQDQDEFGILFDVRGENWPVNLAIDLLGSSKQIDYVDGYTTVSTSELDFGARKIFNIVGTPVYPYVGGGLGLMSARVEDAYYYYGSYIYEDTGFGVWLDGGAYVTLGQFNLGLDLRYSQADVTVAGNKVNAGGSHAGILLGYHW